MIRSEQQLQISRTRREQLRAAAAASQGTDRETWLSLAADIQTDIDEYEGIRAGRVRIFGVSAIDDLPESLIKARIARGLTQRELSERLGVTEQMVQKDEARGYGRASIARLADVADALDYELVGALRPVALPFPNSTPSGIDQQRSYNPLPLAAPALHRWVASHMTDDSSLDTTWAANYDAVLVRRLMIPSSLVTPQTHFLSTPLGDTSPHPRETLGQSWRALLHALQETRQTDTRHHDDPYHSQTSPLPSPWTLGR